MSMRINQKVIWLLVSISMCLVVIVTLFLNSKPDFMDDAEERVGSYLTSLYGGISCSGVLTGENRWEMTCQNQSGQRSFIYTVIPGVNAPQPVSRSFYLIAKNKSARQSAGEGLMRYLPIDVTSIYYSETGAVRS